MTDGPVIQPVRYRPPDAEASRHFRVRPMPAALGALALAAVALLVFLFTARSVELAFSPPAERVELSGGPALAFGDVYLLLRQTYRLRAEASNHHPLDETLQIGPERNQAFAFEFTPLPGLLSVDSTPADALLSIDGDAVGATPLKDLPVPAGERLFRFTHPRHQAKETPVVVLGKAQKQEVAVQLTPNWGEVHYISEPPGARIEVDGEDTGRRTPATVEILAGEHEVALLLKGHQAHRQRILIAAEEQRTPVPIKLRRADARLRVNSRPAGAGLTIDGQYQGETPLRVELRSGRTYRVRVFKAGFAAREASLSLQAGATRTLSLELEQLLGAVLVQASPATAELQVNGRPAGSANQTLELPARPQNLTISAPGYAEHRTEVTPRPGLTLEVRASLLTLAEARLAALRPEIATSQGQVLKLLQPSPIVLGASRREAGRRANETLREVALQRLFYIAVKEVTNAEFRAFASGHDSGSYEDQSLNKDDQPAVNLSWHDAALYCNWLSRQEGLPPFYIGEFGKATGFNPEATGYRLPTEAEWAWAARTQEAGAALLRFPWGEALPPPDRHGNYADRSAGHLVGRIIFGYNDNYAVAAPVGAFAANARGLFDLGGNAAEWVNDYYQHPAPEGAGPLGPATGEYHVMRGSSWMHGTITDLRLSFRDYGIDGRPDLGFRIARFAEADP